MKTILASTILVLWSFTACNTPHPTGQNNTAMKTQANKAAIKSGYSSVNGINMYYEIHGQGQPLVLLHGGGSTIQSTFGRLIPLLKGHRQLICVELQAHGRTGDRSQGLSFEQDADDVSQLLKNLGIQKADVLGFSNGGTTALKLGIRHPEQCRKIIAGSVLLKRDGTFPQFWEFMKRGTFEQMPQQYKDAFLEVNADRTALLNMYQKCADRMNDFKDFMDAELRSIHCPVLLVNGNEDVATPEHIVAMHRLIPGSKLVIVPGGHGEYIGEITTLKPDHKVSDLIVPILSRFLDSPEESLPAR